MKTKIFILDLNKNLLFYYIYLYNKMVKRKRQNITSFRAPAPDDSFNSFIDEKGGDISDIFNKLSFEEIKDVDSIDDLIMNFTKKIHIASATLSQVDNRSMQLRYELQKLRTYLLQHYKDIETVNWMVGIIIDEMKQQKLEEMKRENITTLRQEDEIPSAKDIIEEQEYNDFLKDLENEIPFE